MCAGLELSGLLQTVSDLVFSLTRCLCRDLFPRSALLIMRRVLKLSSIVRPFPHCVRDKRKTC
jgi:hypothetical protein